MRYEDDFGSFWMVDDNEFVKRRHLSRGRPRKYDPSTAAADDQPPPSQSQSQQQSPNQSSSNPNQNQHTKAPTGSHTGSTSKYNDHTNPMQPNPHLMQNVTTNLGQPSNGINHHYFSSPVPPTQ